MNEPVLDRGSAISRRRFVGALSAGLATSAAAHVLARHALAQDPVPGVHGDSSALQSSASNMVMNQDAARAVSRPPKPNATPRVSDAERDALEHRIKCQCGCTLDVYTCRTTDFSCSVSPSMHRDVRELVAGGYSADEIIAAFTDTYGEQVLMAPKREGFNLAGYLAPFVALGAGAVVVGGLIRRWGARAALARPSAPRVAPPLDASADEMARLEAAVRNQES